MSQVLHVRCPHCRNVLRIPAQWLSQPVRCKFCQTVFQGKSRDNPATAVTARPPAPARPAPAAQGRVAPGAPPRPARRPAQPAGRRLPRKPVMNALPAALLVSAMCVGIVFAGHFSWVLMRGDSQTVASTANKSDDSAGKSDDGKNKPIDMAQGNNKKPDDKGSDSSNVKNPDDKGSEVKNPRDKAPDDKGPNIKKPDTPPDDPDLNPKKKKRVDTEPPQFKEDPKRVVELAKPPNPTDPYPRRALLISVNDYLLFNHVGHGKEASAKPLFPGSSTSTLAELLTKPPFNIAEDQITELSDEADGKSNRRPRDPLKQVIKDTLDDFLNGSRFQDRVIVFFAGHIIDGDKECYLVPIEGNKDDVNTMIPLSWVYEKLVGCKAKQKLLILDVCRFPQGKGLERPGEEEMSEQLDTLLANPPVGVQVWSSCIKGQKSYELGKGSVFLEALCTVLQRDYAKDVSIQTKQLPVTLVLPEVNQKMKELLDPLTLTQVSRLAGLPGNESSAAHIYNPDERMPVRLVIAAPKVEGGEVAPTAMVNDILEEIGKLPPIRKGDSLPRLLPTFSAKVLADYKADYSSWDGLKDLIKKEPEKYALRQAVLEAIDIMNDSHNLQMIRKIASPKGQPLDGKVKQKYLDSQKEPGLKIFNLRSALEKLKAVGETSYEKESKRWQANYDLAMARIQARMLYIFEYNYLIGTIRQDLPTLEPGVHNGWTMVSRKDPQVLAKEAEVKILAKFLKKAWRKVAEHADTPWAIIAAREQMSAMGLEWRATKD